MDACAIKASKLRQKECVSVEKGAGEGEGTRREEKNGVVA